MNARPQLVNMVDTITTGVTRKPMADDRDIKELVTQISELIVRRLHSETIEPIHKDLKKLALDVNTLSAAVLGNGTKPLFQQIDDVKEYCTLEIARLEARFEGREREVNLKLEAANREKEAVKQDSVAFRSRLAGIWMAVSLTATAISGIAFLVLEILKVIRH